MVRQSQGLLSKFSSQTECKSVIDGTNKNFAEKCFFKLSLSIENIILFVIININGGRFYFSMYTNYPYCLRTGYDVENPKTFLEAGTSGVQISSGSDFLSQASFDITGPFFLDKQPICNSPNKNVNKNCI